MDVNRKRRIIAVSIILFLLLLVSANHFMQSTEYYEIEKQYLGELDNVPDGGNENYLIIDVIDYELGHCPHYYKEINQTLYFEREHQLKNNLNDGDVIKANWEYSVLAGAWHINGIKKVTGEDADNVYPSAPPFSSPAVVDREEIKNQVIWLSISVIILLAAVIIGYYKLIKE